ncbi:c-type cytochrome [Pontibacter anaerobius]|uniref:Cytochrome c n=1 Tax=Pontibacter anaerobius TaxID=2993940 RepID=A0ABT3RHM5_9BACT|nr:cytochrome c [Pontibacter anaerobius]MCX2740946.1 cytochrome c [Pontibacter anaerobius]
MIKGLFIAFILTTGLSSLVSPTEPAAAIQADTLKESLKRGEKVYMANCQSCHMPEGEGIPATFPPLAKSDYLMKDQKRAIGTVLHGLSGEITVNGEKYSMDMPAMSYLSDEEVADVLNYIQNNWGNKAKAVTPAQVKAERKK